MSQKVPIFKEVAGSLGTRIRQRELTPGMALPSENELCRQFNISRFSVRKALDILEADGLIFRQAGVGSFVSESSQPKKAPKTLNIAVTATDSNFYAEEVYLGARKACDRLDARLVLTSTEDFIARDGGDLDGFIVMPRRETPAELERLNAISGSGIPVFLLNRFTDLQYIAYATVDYELESRRALEFLFRMGKKEVALVNSRTGSSYANATRSRGYSEACRQAGRKELVCTLERDDISAVYQLEEFLREHRPEALFITVSDLVDYVLLASRNCGRAIGKDLTVMCFDKVRPGGSGRSEIMYIDMPLASMAAKAVEFIAARRRGGASAPVYRELFGTRFVLGSDTF